MSKQTKTTQEKLAYAMNLGLAWANEINSDKQNHQDGAGKMTIAHGIPEGDYVELKTLDIDPNDEDIVRAYRHGYNSAK